MIKQTVKVSKVGNVACAKSVSLGWEQNKDDGEDEQGRREVRHRHY
jgi:hypothetical protein